MRGESALVLNVRVLLMRPNAQGKRRRSTEGAQGTNTGHDNAEGMACVGVRLTAQLGRACLRAGTVGASYCLVLSDVRIDEIAHQKTGEQWRCEQEQDVLRCSAVLGTARRGEERHVE